MPTVPEVLLRRLYIQGSLVSLPDGFAFQLKNTLLAVTVTGMQISADGKLISVEDVTFQLEGQDQIKGDSVSQKKPFTLPMNLPLRIEVHGANCKPAKLTIEAQTAEVGPLKFTVSPSAKKDVKSANTIEGISRSFNTLARSIKAANNPHHPMYHFTPAANWMNDPNGLVAWQGRTHLFYQHNPSAPVWGDIHWGHAESRDLVHWQRRPMALAPREGTPNGDGCWSGSAVVTGDGPAFFYTAVFPETVCLARPDAAFRRLVDDPHNPIISAPPPGLDVEGFRDPCVWREDGCWYMTIGSGIKGVGGAVLLYRSSDLYEWEYLHPLLVGDIKQTNPIATGNMWECPQLVKIGAWHFLFISAIIDPQTQYTIYYRGKMKEMRFVPDSMHRLDGGSTLYAPLTFEDVQNRRIMFGWIREERDDAACKKAGWAGALSLPQLLSTSESGELLIEPAPETRRLRKYFLDSFSGLLRSEPVQLSGTHSLLNIEINAFIELPADGDVLFMMAASTTAEENLTIRFDRDSQTLIMDATRIGGSRMETSLVLSKDETLDLQIFLDGSVLEIFANRRAVITARLYPTRMDPLRLFGRSFSQARIIELELYQMGTCFS
jgi:beta-fructofuranosidase